MKNTKELQDSYAKAEHHLQYTRCKTLAKVLCKDFDMPIIVRNKYGFKVLDRK